MTPKVAVAILNWNGVALLRQFLPSVVAHTPPTLAEVVVIDNGSTDDSVQMIHTDFPSVRIITLDSNYGFAEGYNRGLEQLNTPYAVLLNSDVEVTAGWIEPMVDYLDHHPQTVAAQPKIKDYKNKKRFEYAGACGGFIDKFGFPFCRGRILEQVEEDNGQYDAILPILWASGAALFIRLAEYKACGGLDDSFFAHMEEIDLCWRLVARGHTIVSIPQSTVYHVGGATLPTDSPRKLYLNFRNNLLMLYKNLPRTFFLRVMIARYCLDTLAALRLLLTGNTTSALSVVRAHRDFLQIKHRYRPQREENWAKSHQLYHSPVFNQSIIFNFYFSGRKRFSQLKFE